MPSSAVELLSCGCWHLKSGLRWRELEGRPVLCPCCLLCFCLGRWLASKKHAPQSASQAIHPFKSLLGFLFEEQVARGSAIGRERTRTDVPTKTLVFPPLPVAPGLVGLR
jgi:hypothetical protein